MKTKSMSLFTAALCGLALSMGAMAQPAGDPFANPKAAPVPGATPREDIAVILRADGSVTVEGQPYTLPEFEAKLKIIIKEYPDQRVQIASEGVIPAQRSAELIQAIQRAGVPVGRLEKRFPDMLVRYEVFSVDPAKAAAMRRTKPTDTKFYADITAMLEKGEAAQESLLALRCASGQRSKLESVNREIYPAEWDPQPAGSLPGAPGENPPKTVVPVMAEAFENRNTGDELEVEPTMMENSADIELRIVPAHVWLAERTPWGKETSLTEMPVFESQSLNTNVSLTEGKPFLLGTLSPPQGSKVHPDRTWFAFVTVSAAAK